MIVMHESDSLKLGDSVFARNFGTGQKWLAGTVVTVKGQSCTVELADGRNIRCHLDHIHPCNTAELPATEAVQEPWSTRVRRPPGHFGFSYY